MNNAPVVVVVVAKEEKRGEALSTGPELTMFVLYIANSQQQPGTCNLSKRDITWEKKKKKKNKMGEGGGCETSYHTRFGTTQASLNYLVYFLPLARSG